MLHNSTHYATINFLEFNFNYPAIIYSETIYRFLQLDTNVKSLYNWIICISDVSA